MPPQLRCGGFQVGDRLYMTQEEMDRLTPDERARLEAAEQEALKMLARQMREGRRYPRRHMQFSLALFIGGGALVLLLVYAFQLIF